MKIIVIGATGTIGGEVAKALSQKNHEVIGASRKGDFKVSLEDPASVQALFDKVGKFDGVVVCTGDAVFKPFAQLTDADYESSFRSKLMGQASVARYAVAHLNDGGSITLTSGVLAAQPIPGCAAVSAFTLGVEGFVRAVALELPRGLRINAVSPQWIKETMVKYGMDPTPGIAAADAAKFYVAAVEGSQQGQIIEALP
jgi:NAD(P)-dependent dehydrogenase (short-subunit alcohol dehydrogenase family)